MSKSGITVAVIGPGNWGTSLVAALRAARVPLIEVIGRAGPSRFGNKSVSRATLDAQLWWLCVPDAAIAPVSRSLIRRAAFLGVDVSQKLIVHSSGALTSLVLAPAALAGAAVGSVHPVMSFPTRRVVPLQGIPFGIEGKPRMRRVLGALVRKMGGQPFSIAPGKKALYHAAGVLASPLLVSHLVAVQQLAAVAGFSPRQTRALFQPMALATLANVFSRGGAKSFSGPIARGDVATIRLHLQSLESHPMVAAVYRSLALYALENLPSRGGKELRRLLRAK